MTSGVHHLYVETRDWGQSVAFWEALGFRLDEGWGVEQHDGILSPVDAGGPYVFLRQAPDGQDGLAFQVVLGARDLDLVVEADGVLVDRPRYASGWGPDLMDVRDPDGRILTIREDTALKRDLAAIHGSDPNRREPYRRGKSSFIQEVTELGLADASR